MLGPLERREIGDILLVCLADALVGASFGAIAVAGGLPWWLPVVMSVVVFAGASQFAATAVLLAGGGPTAAVITGLVVNARLLPFGFAVGDLLGSHLLTRLLGVHLMTDESVAFALLHRAGPARRAAYWYSGIGLFVLWNLGVVLGALVGRGIGDVNALGLDAAFPAVLVALVMPALARRDLRRAARVGAALAVAVAPVLPAGLPVLFALAGLLLVRRETGGEREEA